jgi:hypothetical protein
LEEATLALIAINLSNEIEEMIIGGDPSIDPNHFKGMEKTLVDSLESVQLAGQVLTKSNVLDAIESVYNAIPEPVLQAEDAGTLYIMGSYGTRRLIHAALADKNNQVIHPAWASDDTDKRNPRLYYLGVEFIPVKGIGDNTLIGYDSRNAYLLTDLLSDLDEIELGNFPAPNDAKVFIRGRLRLGFTIPFEEEMVIMSTAISQDRPLQLDSLHVSPNSLLFLAEGGELTFTIRTNPGVAPVVTSNSPGFTVEAGTTTAGGVTVVTVTAEDNSASGNPRTGEALISLSDNDRTATVTFNQPFENVSNLIP